MKVNLAFLQHPKTRPNVEIILIKNSFRNEIEFCIFTVSENKTLCHPASVDSLSTSAGTEDHVWML
jgi:hypothetical protein